MLLKGNIYLFVFFLATQASGNPKAQELKRLKSLRGELTIAEGNTVELERQADNKSYSTATLRIFFGKTPEEGKLLQAEYERLAEAAMEKANQCGAGSNTFLKCVEKENRDFQNFTKQNKSCELRRADRKNDRLILTSGTKLIFPEGYGDANEGYGKAVKAQARDGRSMDLQFFCSFIDGKFPTAAEINNAFNKYGILGSLEMKSKAEGAPSKPAKQKEAGAVP